MDHLRILQHALGTDEYGRNPRGFSDFTRNHFCAGGADEALCRDLVAMGYMRTFERSWLPYYNCTVTPEGKAAMLRESSAPPPEPKLTRSQKRYREFLDADSGYSFHEWLGIRKKRTESF